MQVLRKVFFRKSVKKSIDIIKNPLEGKQYFEYWEPQICEKAQVLVFVHFVLWVHSLSLLHDGILLIL